MSNSADFDYKKCIDYIHGIEDYTLNVLENKYYDSKENAIINSVGKVGIKELLTKFLLECEKEKSRGRFDFITWLDSRKHFWQKEQKKTAEHFNSFIEMQKGAEKEQSNKMFMQSLKFFEHNHTLIHMIKEDVLKGYTGSINTINEAINSFENPYKIDSIPRIILLAGGRKKQRPTRPHHPYDLPNVDHYDTNGVWVKSAEAKEYDVKFDHAITAIKPVEKVWDFLEYQYANSPHPNSFLKHINTTGVTGLSLLKASPERQNILKQWVQEKQNEIKAMPDEKENKVALTERLLIIRYLEQHNLFPQYNTAKGETKKQFEKFIGLLLSESPNTIKAGFQRVDKIIKGTDLTKENRTERLQRLNNVKTYFAEIGSKEIVAKVDKLIIKVNK